MISGRWWHRNAPRFALLDCADPAVVVAHYQRIEVRGFDEGFCHALNMQSVYEAAGGDVGLLRLAEAWHFRVMADDVVSHAFTHGFHPQHVERLAAYWAEALGGPANYSGTYGDETSVLRIHSGNGEHDEMDRRAIAAFDRALEDVGLTADEPLGQVLHEYFAFSTTTTMSRYPESADDVPEGLNIPRWSWEGRRL